jgi:hypothetical protein
VVIFRGDDFPAWEKLVAEVTAGLEGTDIPVLDLGPALLGPGAPREGFRVHELDPHYNEVAHHLAAEEIERFLRSEQLVPVQAPQLSGTEGP